MVGQGMDLINSEKGLNWIWLIEILSNVAVQLSVPSSATFRFPYAEFID